MSTKAFVVVSIMLFSQSATAQTLTVTINTNEVEHEFGEPGQLTVVIANHGAAPAKIDAMSLQRPADQLLQVVAPNGEKVRTLKEYAAWRVPQATESIILPPGGSHVIEIDLLEHFPDPYPTGMLHNFDLPGQYTIIARVPIAGHTLGTSGGSHFVESAPVQFRVKALDGARLAETLAKLGSKEGAQKASALNLLRRGGAVSKIPELTSFLKHGEAPEVRREAAHSISTSPDRNLWKTYSEFLTDRDATVRGFVAHALGKIGNTEACSVLRAVTDPQEYPESYAAAFKALIELGDPRLREVAERLQSDAPSPVIREMARGVLRELDAK